ncbi:WxcM-like domain-containing protein [Lentisphaera marina]|uniref:WxcM-like domain-containing protein n=1 Tax=Lentisphaera marina TaxID=1111041 RepID=UPI003B674850
MILPDANIGDNCNICSHCFIENEVIIGDNVTIKNGTKIWDGITVEDNVFIGPNVTFTNDLYPRSKEYKNEYLKTIIKEGATVGASATILPGITIGKKAMIGAGSVVTNDVPPNAIVEGVPARIIGYVGTKTHEVHSELIAKHQKLSTTGTQIINLTNIPDLRGHLCVGELNKELPFVPKRIFYIFDVPSSKVRGAHAHKACHQMLICLKGSVSVITDDGKVQEEITLNKPHLGLLLEAGVWGIQYKYSQDAILLVLASHEYDESDYIRDYDEYIQYKLNK